MNDLTATPNARPYHHGNLREAMVQSALALLEADGPGELSLRRAARDIGVSQTAPLYHFGNKLGLLVAVAIEGFHLLVALRKERIASARRKSGCGRRCWPMWNSASRIRRCSG